MSRTPSIFLFLTIILLVACDPAMTIRQIEHRTPNAAQDQLTIKVLPINSFLGSRFYLTRAKLTNASNSLIKITGCELVARNTTYNSRLGGEESYPIELSPGSSKDFGAVFQLQSPVQDVFRTPAELRVHYTIQGREEFSRTMLVGGSLH